MGVVSYIMVLVLTLSPSSSLSLASFFFFSLFSFSFKCFSLRKRVCLNILFFIEDASHIFPISYHVGNERGLSSHPYTILSPPFTLMAEKAPELIGGSSQEESNFSEPFRKLCSHYSRGCSLVVRRNCENVKTTPPLDTLLR